MTHTEAAEILRGKKGASMRNIFESERMGAEALEAWAWVAERQALVSRQHGRWLCAVGLGLYAEGPTPLAAVLDAMEKEGKE